MAMNRQEAWTTVCEFVKEPGLRRHMVAVEAAMRWYARRLGEDEGAWGLAGLLHDFDWEVHPNLNDHPAKGAAILRGRGVEERVINCILAHNPAHTGVAPTAAMDFGLNACDEVTGLIIAVALVRPTKDIRETEVRSVKKKWKEKYFAAGVHREEVEANTAAFSNACFGGTLELWEHVGNVLGAMQGVAGELELDGRLGGGNPIPKPEARIGNEVVVGAGVGSSRGEMHGRKNAAFCSVCCIHSRAYVPRP